MKATASTDQSNLPAVKQETLPADPVERLQALIPLYAGLSKQKSKLKNFEQAWKTQLDSEFCNDCKLTRKQFSLLDKVWEGHAQYKSHITESFRHEAEKQLLSQLNWWKRFAYWAGSLGDGDFGGLYCLCMGAVGSLILGITSLLSLIFIGFIMSQAILGAIALVLLYIYTLVRGRREGNLLQAQKSELVSLLEQKQPDEINQETFELHKRWQNMVKCYWLPKFIEAGKEASNESNSQH